VPRQAPCRLEVWADGRAAFRSPMLTPQDAARVVRVNVERCRRLRLRAVTDGSTDKLAYAVWGFPRLLRGPFDA